MNDYINANFIPGPKGESNQFIACQGPKKGTVVDFWRMVKQENVGLIVMLCKTEEDGRPKCEHYWPESDSSNKYESINLEVKSESDKDETNNLSYREFSLIDTSSNSTVSTVKKVHYSGWPDHGVPHKDQLRDFDTLVEYTMDAYRNFREEDNPRKILIHCSAGIGRTGTLLTILHIISNIESARAAGEEITNISVFSTVRKLREHRFHLVQSESQYMFIYQYLAQYLKKIKLL